MRQDRTTSRAVLQLELATSGTRRDALERALRAAIRDGRLASGSLLPSSRALAIDLGLSRGTVVEAFTQLAAEGYLEARRGSGTRVSRLEPGALRAERSPPPVDRRLRFSFHPGLPDLTAFPRAAWSAALRRGLREVPAHELGYGDVRGRADLRLELAQYLARARGAATDPERVMICAGFRHGLALVCRALADRGATRIAMEDPCLPDHREVATAAGLAVVPLPVDDRGARTDLLSELDVCGVVLGPAHQFPLGVVLHPERRAAAVEWARMTDGIVIEDDYDGELRFDRAPVGVLQALDPERVVYGGTASKTLVPGLRLGWLLLPQALLEPIAAIRDREDVHVAVPEQLALAELFRNGGFERHVRRMRSRYRSRRDRVVELLVECAPSVRTVGISAGLRVLLELPRDSLTAAELVSRAAERSVELFAVGPAYLDGRARREGILVGYGALAEHDVDSGLIRLGEVLAAALGPR